jgi:hypothetical protein
MRKLPLILLVLITACSGQTALKYNEDVIDLEHSLVPDIEKTENAVAQYIDHGHIDSIAYVARPMEQKVDSAITKLKALKEPDTAEGKAFKRSSIGYFEYMKSIYTAYRTMAEAPEDARDAAIANVQSLATRKDSVVNDMQQAQRRFAKASGFKIKE